MKEEKYCLLTRKPQLFCLSEKVNGHRIFMYRDDPEDFGFGGNKVRFFEYLIPDILEANPSEIVTSGSMFSNHIRVTAQVASHLGIPCKLLLTEDALPDNLTGNIALAREYKAETECIGHFAALLKINEYMNKLKENGKKAFLVPNGGHAPGAVRAYAQVVSDTMDELESQGIRPSAIYLPCASGTTHSGVLCAAAKRRIPKVVSFAVANTPERARKGISKLIGAAKDYLPTGFETDSITVCDCGKNDYGHPDGDLISLREKLFKSDGVLLDPTYNINAFYGMWKALENCPGNEDVLYINTGGYTAY